ncbi:hypothetical protein [Lacisediminihabitans profunda]|uniref:SGNH/GDSL hydrolase family protein n=1 Tax=Lacisediminihabitans profunda TaxID=2594790 RepID=A0A5C8UQB3_9MICO|nr:hypothetical protein [Lacisediminihabitans profunda]TXN30693.1 hypothetical protein FVP33_09285 [Lacisediminihabitans profunda]
MARSLNLAEFLFPCQDASGDSYPTDSAGGVVEGDDSYRIITIGEGTAVGLGVRSHELGVAAQCARRLARAAGSGVYWSSVGFPDGRLRSAPAITSSAATFARIDVVILMIGITDTLRMTSRSSWRRLIAVTVDQLAGHLASDGQVLVAEIPPMDNAGSISRAARLASGHQARVLNRITREVVATRPRVSSVAFPASLHEGLRLPESRQSSYGRMYAEWGAALATAVTTQPISRPVPTPVATTATDAA